MYKFNNIYLQTFYVLYFVLDYLSGTAMIVKLIHCQWVPSPNP